MFNQLHNLSIFSRLHRQYKVDRTKIKKATPQNELATKIAISRINKCLLNMSVVVTAKDAAKLNKYVSSRMGKLVQSIKHLENSKGQWILRISDLRLYRLMTNNLIGFAAPHLSSPLFERGLQRNSPSLTQAMINVLSQKFDVYSGSCNYLSFLLGSSTQNSDKILKIIQSYSPKKHKNVNLAHILPFVLRHLSPEHFAESIPMLKELIGRVSLLNADSDKLIRADINKLVQLLDSRKHLPVAALLSDVLCDFEDSTLRMRAFTHVLIAINNLTNGSSIDHNIFFFEQEFADSQFKENIIKKLKSIEGTFKTTKGIAKIQEKNFEDRRQFFRTLVFKDQWFNLMAQPQAQFSYHSTESGLNKIPFVENPVVKHILSYLTKDEAVNESALKEEAARIELLSKLGDVNLAKDVAKAKNTMDFVNDLNNFVDRGMNPLNRIQENWKFQNELEFHYVKNHVMASRRTKRFVPTIARNFSSSDDRQKRNISLEKLKEILKAQSIETAKAGKVNIDQKSMMDVDLSILKLGRDSGSKDVIVEEILSYIAKINGDQFKLSRVFKSLFLYDSLVKKNDSVKPVDSSNEFVDIVLRVLITDTAEDDSLIMVKNDSKFGMIEMDFNKFSINKAFNFKFSDKLYISLFSSFDNYYSDIKFKILLAHYLKFQDKASHELSTQIYSLCRKNKLPMLLIYILHNQISRGNITNALFYEALDHLSVFKYFNEEGINLFFLMFKKSADFYPELGRLNPIFESLIVNDQQRELFLNFEQLRNLFESNFYVTNHSLTPEKNLELEEQHKLKQLEHKKQLYSMMFGLCIKYRIKSYADMLYNEMTTQNYFKGTEDIMNMIRYAQKDKILFKTTINYILTTMDAANDEKVSFSYEDTEEVIALMVKRANDHRREFMRVFKLFFGKTKSRISDGTFVECLKFFYITEDFKAFEYFLNRTDSQVKALRIQLAPVSKSIALKVCSKCRDDTVRFNLINSLDSIFSFEKKQEKIYADELTDEEFNTLIQKTQAIIDSRFDLKYDRTFIPRNKNKPKPSRPVKDRRNALTTLVESLYDTYLTRRIEKDKAQIEAEAANAAQKQNP